MFKLKIYLWNTFFSSLIGLIVNITFLFMYGWRYFSFHGLLISMGIGAVIGTVSLFFLFRIFLGLTHKPFLGFVSNFLVVAVLNLTFTLFFGGLSSPQVILAWGIVLLISELLSIFLTYAWYRRIIFYNQKLEQKKASLGQGDASPETTIAKS